MNHSEITPLQLLLYKFVAEKTFKYLQKTPILISQWRKWYERKNPNFRLLENPTADKKVNYFTIDENSSGYWKRFIVIMWWVDRNHSRDGYTLLKITDERALGGKDDGRLFSIQSMLIPLQFTLKDNIDSGVEYNCLQMEYKSDNEFKKIINNSPELKSQIYGAIF